MDPILSLDILGPSADTAKHKDAAAAATYAAVAAEGTGSNDGLHCVHVRSSRMHCLNELRGSTAKG